MGPKAGVRVCSPEILMDEGRQNLPTKISGLFTKRTGQKWPKTASAGMGSPGVTTVDSGSPECSSATMGTQHCGPMYSKLCVTVWRSHSMQKFRLKMTPRSLCTKFGTIVSRELKPSRTFSLPTALW